MREGERKREKDINLLFRLFMPSLVDSYRCSYRGLTPQPLLIWTLFSPTELPGQGPSLFIGDTISPHFVFLVSLSKSTYLTTYVGFFLGCLYSVLTPVCLFMLALTNLFCNMVLIMKFHVCNTTDVVYQNCLDR